LGYIALLRYPYNTAKSLGIQGENKKKWKKAQKRQKKIKKHLQRGKRGTTVKAGKENK